MDNFRAVGIAEGFIETDDEAEVVAAWQHLVDTGIINHLQGSYQRTAQQLLEAGMLEE